MDILTPRFFPAVVPINDTEIAIMGGQVGDEILSEIFVLNTTTKLC